MAGLKRNSILARRDDEEILWDDKEKLDQDPTDGERIPFKNASQTIKNDDQDKHEGKAEPMEKPQMVGLCELFRFSDRLDRVMMFIGFLGALGQGGAYPLTFVIFGKTIDFIIKVGTLKNYLGSIPEFLSDHGYDEDDFMANTKLLNDAMCDDIELYYNGTMNCTVTLDHTVMQKMRSFCLFFGIVGGSCIVLGYIQLSCWLISAERQVHRIRQSCLNNILRQDIGWFDNIQAGQVTTQLSEDIPKILDGVGDKSSGLLRSTSAVIFSLVLSFYYGWKLTLVTLSSCPVLGILFTWMAKLSAKGAQEEAEAYGKAGSVAEEVFGAIRTVVAFGGQEKEIDRYCGHLDKARRSGVKKGFMSGALNGVMWLMVFSLYGLTFWYGGKLNRDDPDGFMIGDLILVFYVIMYGSYELGTLAPSFQALATSRAAASSIFKLIDKVPNIDSLSDQGSRPTSVHGLIQFKDIHFNYPARPNVKVLNNLSLEARPGQTVALVGSSGCGKSTIVQLLLRFYDPAQGQVLLDGRNIKEINIKWLRGSIGMVSQEPVLFADTIEQNIRYGRHDVTFDQIVSAAKNANAYEFISQLPDKFNTLVGERGAQLSGGQKQRIAIARALVRDPKILLLDEATSALDTESEAIVQDALDKARQGRTTIVIAHRLSTIKTADIIVGMSKGQVKEMGTHAELMSLRGIYHQLVVNQKITEKDEGDDKALTKTEHTKQKDAKFAKVPKREEEKQEELEDTDEYLPNSPFTRLLLMNVPEFHYILLGCLASIGCGSTYPSLIILITKFIKVFEKSDDDSMDDIVKYSLIFVGIGFINFAIYFLQSFMFSLAGQALTQRIRNFTFRAMLKQDIAWFDQTKNGVGALTTRLSTDAFHVQGLTVYKIGTLVMALSGLVIGISYGFYYGWQMTLVLLAMLPVLSAGMILQMSIQARQAIKNKPAIDEAGRIIMESLENIRTVAALSQEELFFDRYMTCMSLPYVANKRIAHATAFLTGFGQAVLFLGYSASLAFGGYMVEQGEMEMNDVLLVFGIVLFGAIGISNASTLFPDLGRAQTAARRIFQIIDAQPEIDYTNTSGKRLQSEYRPTVTFNDVRFHYATRASVPVLQGLNVSVTPGQTLALVGSSGCGKSTTIQLIERFYDSIQGSVCLDGSDIKSLNVQWYRNQFGLVSQEPTLFNCSIRDNIAYGDNTRDVTMTEIIEAAKKANIHYFISSLPLGYDTNVGAKGTQLSGGQKQRIAIARALIRNPKVLLLDEATSALDTESEKIVQEALDKARSGRACIVIAHRLSTIQNADRICVIDKGSIVEEGTHEDLLDRQGIYYKLVVRSSQKTT